MKASKSCRQPFLVSCQAPKTCVPGEAFPDVPSAGQQNEAAPGLGMFDHIQLDAVRRGRILSGFSRVPLIDIGQVHTVRGDLLHLLDQALHLGPVLFAGRGHMQPQQVPQRVRRRMHLPSLAPFGRVVSAAVARLRSGLQGAAVEDHRRRLCAATGELAQQQAQVFRHASKNAAHISYPRTKESKPACGARVSPDFGGRMRIQQSIRRGALLCVPGLFGVSSLLALTVSPVNPTVSEGATQQFTASAAATWKASCGSITSSGLYTARYVPGPCTITATATGGSGATGSTTANIVSPIILSPVKVSTPQGQTQQFTASMPVNWSAGCGTITSGGLFTATSAVGTRCTIQALGIGNKYSAYAYDTVAAVVSFSISPLNPTLSEGATQQFTASAAATWAASCGTISSAGLFTAPMAAGSCTITATATDGSGHAASTTATVTDPLTVTPATASTPQGTTQQFTANLASTWAASCGSITSSGLFTASSPVGTSCTITATATGGTAYKATAVDTVAAATTLTISPLNPTLSEGSTQQFTASAGATWAASCGSISSAGLFTAPMAPGSCTITATATDGSGHTASTTATVTSPLTIAPASASTPQGATQQFTASMAVSWAASCGSITSGGLFTASSPVGTRCTITATATGGTAYTATAPDIVASATALTVSPINPTITEGATDQFDASAAVTWAASCGSISSAGLYTARYVPGPCTITATATDGSGHTASSTANIVSPIIMTPTSASTPQGQTQQFTTNVPVNWSAGCGSITSGGLFTASAPVGTRCTLQALESGTKYSAYGYDTVLAPLAWSISPLNPTVSEGATQQFAATEAVTWTASCGSITGAGLFTAPTLAGACTITATATDGTGQTEATIATITNPLSITPASASTPQGATQQFTANMAVSWAASCGSITSGGLFTASGTAGTSCTITATATGVSGLTATAVDTVGAATLTPLNPTITEGATQQFTSSLTATWTASCGTITSAGLYTARLVPGTCTITATPTSGGASLSTSANIVSPISMFPIAAKTQQGQPVLFTASAPVIWSASCGTMTSSGLYTASAAVGTQCSIQAVAASGTRYSVYGSDTVLAPLTWSISPLNPAVSEGATQQFAATEAVTWAAGCGAISAGGLYTAPLSPGSCMVTAAATDGSGQTNSTTATITSPLTITPASASTPQGATQQFTASMAVSWAASCGSITSGGLFTASSSDGSRCIITAAATGGTAYTATAIDTIAASTALTISPVNPKVSEAASQQFIASAASTWGASCGSITAAGVFTAPLSAGLCTITATASDGSGRTATSTATITSPLIITPSAATTAQGTTQQFTANLASTWAASCGSITSSGLFTASPAAGASCTITATATGGAAYTATAVDTIAAASALTITPTAPTVNEGATQSFTASIAASWTASCGSITSAGVYTAPLVTGPCTVTATATDGSGQVMPTAVNVVPPFTITPASGTTYALGPLTFSASVPVSWTTSCGSITSAGVFTAPGTAGACTITATATSGAAYTATAIADVALVNYTTWKNDNLRTGLQPQETVLTPSNVNANQFGVSWTTAMDGEVWGQPLYMNALTVGGTVHNVLFVATSNDSVYALNADSGTQLWKTSFLSAGVTTVNGTAIGSNYAQIGILSTPVIDPSTGTLYVLAMTNENGGSSYVYRLHALDVTTGNQTITPAVVSYPEFQDVKQMQRPALLLANHTVYVAFASVQDLTPFHGFVFGYDAATLTPAGVFNSTPSGVEGGIWMGGAGPAADAEGNIYFAVGNGYWDGIANYGDSVVQVGPDLSEIDYFTPYNQATFAANDLDLGSGGVMLLPNQTGNIQHEAIVCGKPTSIYVLNRDDLGGHGATSDNIVQRLDNQVGTSSRGCFTSPAIWQQNVYFGGYLDALKMFTLDPKTGLLSATPQSQGAFTYGYPGSQPVVSSNGSSNAIVWTVDQSSGTLRAYDATNLSNALYVSSKIDSGITWEVPTVVNGHVYVGLQHEVVAFTIH